MFNIANYPTSLGQDLVIKKVGHIVDTFFGKDGWKPHARFHIKRTSRGTFLSQVNGDKVPQHIFKSILEKVL
jgi:hypothetical protein